MALDFHSLNDPAHREAANQPLITLPFHFLRTTKENI